MIKPEQIPDEVVEALAGSMNWRSAVVFERDRDLMRKHIAAALNAWPGEQESGMTYGKIKTRIYILPLPMENSDE